MQLDHLVQVARGDRQADLVLRNARVVNVFAGDVELTDVALAGGVIAGLGREYRGAREVDMAGQYLAPGFIDAHMHVESTMVPVPEFARAVVPQGTTTVIVDPHEIANVLGIAGIRYMLDSSESGPLGVFVMLPSAVPATTMETSGAVLRGYDLYPLLRERRVLGIGEMMNYPGVVSGDPEVLGKAIIAGGKRVDGHAPGLSGRGLNAYAAAGIGSDHECTTLEEAEQRLRLGMYVMIREASNARNLAALLPLVTPATSRRCLLVTDDRTPADLLDEGHVNFLVRKAIGLGLDPVTAIQLATLNAAEYFGLRDRGAIAPGRVADLVVLDSLTADLAVRQVYRGGQLVAADGELLAPAPSTPPPPSPINVHEVGLADLRLPATGHRARIIGLVPDQIVTRALVDRPKIEDGAAVADVERDIQKLAVVERHRASGNVGLGLVQGFGLRRGALASSVAHDSHNIVVVGANDADMLAAVEAIVALGGGQVAVADGEVLARVPLPIAGLMSDQPLAVVREQVDQLVAAARALGSRLHSPFMALSFLALPVIPELKLTDHGLVDVTAFQLVPVFEAEN
jgi:adenine deaminase